jgi:hypothetical protein
MAAYSSVICMRLDNSTEPPPLRFAKHPERAGGSSTDQDSLASNWRDPGLGWRGGSSRGRWAAYRAKSGVMIRLVEGIQRKPRRFAGTPLHGPRDRRFR